MFNNSQFAGCTWNQKTVDMTLNKKINSVQLFSLSESKHLRLQSKNRFSLSSESWFRTKSTIELRMFTSTRTIVVICTQKYYNNSSATKYVFCHRRNWPRATSACRLTHSVFQIAEADLVLKLSPPLRIELADRTLKHYTPTPASPVAICTNTDHKSSDSNTVRSVWHFIAIVISAAEPKTILITLNWHVPRSRDSSATIHVIAFWTVSIRHDSRLTGQWRSTVAGTVRNIDTASPKS